MKKRISSVIHIWIALFFTLSTTLPASVASASPLSSADESTVQRSEPDENPSGSSDPYAIEPETGFEVVQNADPYLMSLALGNEEPVSPYGPARNDPDQGIPAHAYSPFDDPDKREVCPPGGCDYMADRVLIKFDAKQAFVKVGTTDIAPKDMVLANALDEAGILSIKPLFPNAETPALDAKIQTVDGELIPEPDLTRWYEALTQSESDLGAVIEQLQGTDGIAVAEPDFIRKPIGGASEPQSSLPSAITASTQALPGSTTDPLYDQQWHLGATHVPEAWAYLESQGLPAGGSRDIIVAVIDTGVDYTHPDLAANIWVNPAEFNGVTGVDDDGNGYIDDIHGTDTVYPDGDPMDDHGHGTHVAGIIAAQANNGIGGVGVAYNVQLMPIKAAQYSGVLASSDIAEAIYYAVAKGADVINMSFGGYARSNVEEDALAVAFGQAVLVAAAGNDDLYNKPCGVDMFPAAYNWVLGVMASTSGDALASFSNRDCQPHDTHEYELMAPGVGIWSTLPASQYAAWSGTSMSAPVVSGIAALARTKWADKDVYSSRFIMGQIASNTTQEIGGVANTLTALTVPPRPELSFLEHWLFDTPDIDPINDSDGIVDAGETVDLAVVIRNHWGKAENVTVTLEAWADGAVFPDPYVTIINDTVNYGAVGSFNWDDNGLIYNEEGVIVGVNHPFTFTTDPNTPNDHVIPFKLTLSAENGFNPDDPNSPYISESRFFFVVLRGRELPSIISSDMQLSNDYFWIVSRPTLIENGVTVSVSPGTQLFWRSHFIQNEGKLLAVGTNEAPVEFFNSEILSYYTPIYNFGELSFSYLKLLNPYIIPADGGMNSSIEIFDHCYVSETETFYFQFTGDQINDTIFNKLRGASLENGVKWRLGFIENSLFNGSWLRTPVDVGQVVGLIDTVFLQDNWNNLPVHLYLSNCQSYDPAEVLNNCPYYNNAFLNKYWDPDSSHLMNISAGGTRNMYYGFANNYWGTLFSPLIDRVIYDYADSFNQGIVIYQPILTTAPVTAYPFVVDVILSTSSDPDASIVGAEPVTFTVTFNRDMDQTIQPMVSFGPDVPMTDYTVHPINGGWTDARTWAGTFNINPITGDGYQLIRVAGAVAADDPWLVTGDDAGRFRFEIITSGTEAMNLQATGGEGYVDLMWTQTDFELLSGFHLYRSTSLDGTYTRINPSIIPPDVRAYRDTDVLPGQPYFYKFTVVKSDMTESDFSNVATATPLDTIPPVLTHTLLTTAEPGLPLSFTASATDNVGVTGVTLYYRHTGDTTYLSKAMVKTTGSEYYATIEGSLLTSPGIEYYIEATDGISVTRSGRAENPNPVIVVDKPVLTIVTPNSGPTVGGTEVTISGSNFKSGATVTFGGAAASNVIVVSSNQVTCTTPPHIPETVDVRVTNPDTQYGVLLNGFTFFSTAAQVSLPATGGGTGNLVTVPVNAANINGMVAASLTVNFDPAVLTARSAGTGSLTSGWSFASNLTTSGQVRLSMVSPGGGVSGAGTLANIEFEVTGAPGSSSALSISSILLNDGAITVELTPGTFNVDNVYNVSGAVSFWNGGAPVTGTQLSLTGDRVYTAYSGLDGAYTIQGAAIDGYVLAPSKSDGDDGITAYDASFVLQHDVGLTTLSGYAAVAADVNSNGYITSMDAYYILQKAVDLISLPFPGSGVVWKFDPADRSIPLLTGHLSGQNFTAILLGDISGNWSEPGESGSLGKLHDAEAASAILTIPAVTVLPSGTVDVPITLDITDADLYGAELTFTYNPAHVAISGVGLGLIAEGWSIASNLVEPGVVKIAMAGANPITSDGELVAFTVTPLGSPGTQSNLTLTRGDLDEGAIPITLHSGVVSISGSSANDDIDTPISILTVPSEYIQDTSSSTHETGDPSFIACGQVAGLASVWYLFEAAEDGEMTLDTMGSSYNTMLGVWRGAPGSLTLVGCNDNALGKVQSQFNFKYTAGVDYYIGVAQKGTSETGGALKFHATTFQDVNGTHPLWRYVEGFFAKGITTGCAVNPMRYCPDQAVTRGQMAVFLLRSIHADDPETYIPVDVEPDTFADPPAAAFMEPWIEQFYATGITTGCASGPLRYCPERNVTRGEMAVFVLRALHKDELPYTPTPGPAVVDIFADVPASNWMKPWIEEFYELGITTGCGVSGDKLLYCPSRNVNRAEMATFVDRAFGFPPLP